MSRVGTANNATILRDFWIDRDVQALPYQRGHLLAHLWDGQLRTSGGLDPVMLDMHRRAIANEHAATHRYAPEIFVDAMTAARYDVHTDLSKYVDAGERIVLPKDLFAPCGAIETREVPAFDRGFDVAATQSANMHLTHVDPDSQGYAAGLRDGMLLLGREAGEIGDSEQELALRVSDAGNERIIRYMPHGKTRVTFQQFSLNTSLDGDTLERCRKRLAGIE